MEGGGSAPGKMWLGFNNTTGANLYPGIFRAQIEYRNAGKREAVSMGICLGIAV
jgi:hypothetical protein